MPMAMPGTVMWGDPRSRMCHAVKMCDRVTRLTPIACAVPGSVVRYPQAVIASPMTPGVTRLGAAPAKGDRAPSRQGGGGTIRHGSNA